MLSVCVCVYGVCVSLMLCMLSVCLCMYGVCVSLILCRLSVCVCMYGVCVCLCMCCNSLSNVPDITALLQEDRLDAVHIVDSRTATFIVAAGQFSSPPSVIR